MRSAIAGCPLLTGSSRRSARLAIAGDPAAQTALATARGAAADSGSGAVELDSASTMDLHELLLQNRTRAIDEALEGLSRSALPHYAVENAAQNRIRLERLYDLCTQCLLERSLIPIADHARQVAGERHREGIDLREVHTAFNVLEEVIWRLITANLQPPQLVQSLGQASTILGAGKQALAVEYVRLVGHHEPGQSLDVSELFKGTA